MCGHCTNYIPECLFFFFLNENQSLSWECHSWANGSLWHCATGRDELHLAPPLTARLWLQTQKEVFRQNSGASHPKTLNSYHLIKRSTSRDAKAWATSVALKHAHAVLKWNKRLRNWLWKWSSHRGGGRTEPFSLPQPGHRAAAFLVQSASKLRPISPLNQLYLCHFSRPILNYISSVEKWEGNWTHQGLI